MRFDDNCKNGHNDFAICGKVCEKRGTRWVDVAFGQVTDEIKEFFPELAPLLKWHLCSTDGPMSYVANTIFLAGDRDCWGLRKGEFKQHISRGPHQNDGIAGVPCWQLKMPEYNERERYSHEKPQAITLEWQPSGQTGEGKERQRGAKRGYLA